MRWTVLNKIFPLPERRTEICYNVWRIQFNIKKNLENNIWGLTYIRTDGRTDFGVPLWTPHSSTRVYNPRTDGREPPPRVILKTVPKYLTLVKKDERVRRPSQRSNLLLKIIHIIYLTYMCVACVTHVTHSSNVLDQILVCLIIIIIINY